MNSSRTTKRSVSTTIVNGKTVTTTIETVTVDGEGSEEAEKAHEEMRAEAEKAHKEMRVEVEKMRKEIHSSIDSAFRPFRDFFKGSFFKGK